MKQNNRSLKTNKLQGQYLSTVLNQMWHHMITLRLKLLIFDK